MKQITITSTFKIVDDLGQASGNHNARVNAELSRFSSVMASSTTILTGLSISQYSIVTFLVGQELITASQKAPVDFGEEELAQAKAPVQPEKEMQSEHAPVSSTPSTPEQDETVYSRPPGKRKPFGA